MKYRYYVTTLFDGCIKGTNNDSKAQEAAECDEFFVLDTQTGMWITDAGPQEIEEL